MNVIFWGGTGQARVLREALPSSTAVLAVFDAREIPSPFPDVPIFCGEAGLPMWESKRMEASPVGACIAIGGKRGKDRLALQYFLAERGYAPVTVVHPRAFLAHNVQIGKGCQLLTLAAVCVGARLGDGVIVNTSASIDHDCIVDRGVHIGPGATLAGEVVVEEFAFVGTAATILPRIRIGRGAIVGAGAVVIRDVPAGATVVGVPAKIHP